MKQDRHPSQRDLALVRVQQREAHQRRAKEEAERRERPQKLQEPRCVDARAPRLRRASLAIIAPMARDT